VDASDNHYAFLGLEPFASVEDVAAAVERVSKQANALANTNPARSQELREQLRQIRYDLLTTDERRYTYDNALLDNLGGDSLYRDSGATSGQPDPVRTPGSVRSTIPPSNMFEEPPDNGGRAATKHRSRFWLIAAIVAVGLVAGGGGFAVARGGLGHVAGSTATSTATSLPSPTSAPTAPATLTPAPVPTSTRVPTAAPPPTKSGNGPVLTGAVRGAISAAIHRSNDAFVSSMACACDRGLEDVKTGADLQTYLGRIHAMQSKGQHENITTNSLDIQSITLETSTSATALVRKDELTKYYTGETMISSCALPYVVEYHLVKVGGDWKVDNTQLPNGYPCS
jgi:ARC6-like, IMS domain